MQDSTPRRGLCRPRGRTHVLLSGDSCNDGPLPANQAADECWIQHHSRRRSMHVGRQSIWAPDPAVFAEGGCAYARCTRMPGVVDRLCVACLLQQVLSCYCMGCGCHHGLDDDVVMYLAAMTWVVVAAMALMTAQSCTWLCHQHGCYGNGNLC
jgi:hypothetical protein